MKRPSRGLRPLAWLGVAVLVMALAAACSSAAVHPGSTAKLDSHRTLFGSVVLDGSPGQPAANARTGTRDPGERRTGGGGSLKN